MKSLSITINSSSSQASMSSRDTKNYLNKKIREKY